MKRLPSQKELMRLFSYKDGKLIWKADRVNNKVRGKVAGTLKTPYWAIRINGIQFYAHRLVWRYFNNATMPDIIDHINQNKLDNRIENLRPATATENCYNKKLSNKNTSGVTGVSYQKNRTCKKKWRVSIGRGSTTHFESFEEAAKFRAKLESKYVNRT